MSTLPRTRSVSAASTSSSSASKDRVRPVSVCDTSWSRITGQEIRQQQLVRTPSQANNLCTTVPQSLVVQNLGGRHTPTRSSLRHSRMIVLSKNGKAIRDRRWAPNSLGRAGVLVVTAQILVGVMGVTLATWLLMWAPILKFREIPHYAGVPVFLAGICGAILISCFQRRRHSSLGSVIKGILVALCCISVVTCLSVCIFTALHLTQLSSMTCHKEHTTIAHPNYSLEEITPIRDSQHIPGMEDDEDQSEGSGAGQLETAEYQHDVFDDVNVALEIQTATLESVTVGLDHGILLNITSCSCEQRGPTWRKKKSYPNLSCLEVNNILPILFVASCVVTAIGAVLSGLVLYLLWSFKNSFYGPAKSHERRPFIFTSNFKNNTKVTNGSNNKMVNGDSRFR